jgi:predicted O-methyltransferase YrrM
MIWLEHADGRVSVDELPDGRHRVTVYPNPGTISVRGECVTAYPVDLITRILEVKSAAYLGDELAREEDPNYVARFLRYALLGYLPEEAFQGARILDFGSGSGASTVILARMFPEAEIVAVELEPDFIDIAKRRAEHYGLSNLVFLQSPGPEVLPDDLGTFMFINLGAVYEHLLPAERPRLLTQLWSRLSVGGVIFVNQLPHRFYPIEAHTTGLPLLNYLPDRMAAAAARRFSARIAPDTSWAEMLRNGVRGGTARSVKRDLERGGGRAQMLTPTRMGLEGHADLWFQDSSEGRPHPAKQVMRVAFKGIERVTGDPFAPGLSLAFQKLA